MWEHSVQEVSRRDGTDDKRTGNAAAPSTSAAFAPGATGSSCQDGFGPDGARSPLEGLLGPGAGGFLWFVDRSARGCPDGRSQSNAAATLSADVRQAAQFPDLPPRRGRLASRVGQQVVALDSKWWLCLGATRNWPIFVGRQEGYGRRAVR